MNRFGAHFTTISSKRENLPHTFYPQNTSIYTHKEKKCVIFHGKVTKSRWHLSGPEKKIEHEKVPEVVLSFVILC